MPDFKSTPAIGKEIEMPLPAADEAQSAFMSRCVDRMLNCSDEMTHAAATAHCSISWDNRPERGTSKQRSAAGALVEKTLAAPPPGSDPLEFVMSDDSVDRMGDIIDQAGWQLADFNRSPVALWDHGHDPEIGRKPVGRWINLRIDRHSLKGTYEPALGISERIDELNKLVERGYLRAVSVGFSSIKSEPIDKNHPFDGTRFLKQELLECSLCAVGANRNALLQIDKSLGISGETMSLIFGKTANEGRVTRAGAPGKSASTPPNPHQSRRINMTTLSQRIEALQADINVKRDRLSNLNDAEVFDADAVVELNAQIDDAEVELAARRASEAKIGLNAMSGASAGASAGVSSPAIIRRPFGFQQKEITGLDLLVRSAIVVGSAAFGGKTIQQALDERYPGHEATAAFVTKADQTLGTTTGSGWVDALQQTSYKALVDALRGLSIWPTLVDGSMSLSFDQFGTAYIPSLTAGGANGGFFGEGAPMRVGRITVASTTMTPRKMGVIIPFSREAAKRSTPALEPLVRRAIVGDTAKVLDQAVIDAVAGDTVRPAGLLNGVSATAAGFGGGDYLAVIEDINALMAPFDTADGSDGIALIMHPAQARKLMMMPGPDGTFGWQNNFMNEFKIVRSTHATAGRIIAIRLPDLITVAGVPEFEVSTQATIHMEDTTPLEIVSGTGPTAADPVRSFYQTDSMGVRMVMEVSWKMARSGMVQWINGTSW